MKKAGEDFEIPVDVILKLFCRQVQLRRFLVASTDPDLWAEQREDEGELVEFMPRQLDGVGVYRRLGVEEVNL